MKNIYDEFIYETVFGSRDNLRDWKNQERDLYLRKFNSKNKLKNHNPCAVQLKDLS